MIAKPRIFRLHARGSREGTPFHVSADVFPRQCREQGEEAVKETFRRHVLHVIGAGEVEFTSEFVDPVGEIHPDYL